MEGRLLRLLRALQDGGVEFILVGGLSAVLHGAPIHTQDVDIVPQREPQNLERLLRVLDGLDAVYRAQPERRLRPALGHLEGPGHHNLVTRDGWLDVLGEIGVQQGYEELLVKSPEMEVAPGLRVRVLDLETYIALKQHLGGDKDLAVLPVLRQTLRERARRGRRD